MHDTRDVVNVLSDICERVGSPRALTCFMLANAGEWDQLVSLTVDPSHYTNADYYFLDRQVTDLLRKCNGLPISADLHANAVKTFWDCERKCYVANERLSPLLDNSAFLPPIMEQFKRGTLRELKREIRRILGRLPESLTGRLGPGATYSDKGRGTTTPHKFSSVPSLTPEVVPLLTFWDDAWSRNVAKSGGKLNYCRGNRFTSVPKDSTKNRGICIEPSLNIWFQLAVGSAIRRRLKRSLGIDLENGQSVHRLEACRASLTGLKGTIDLSNASDTVCRNLVKLLLPQEWFDLLDSLRSPFTFIEGKWVKLEKFSSMGNGFTFELETLIFVSIARVVSGYSDCLCYGDDLIVPSSSFKDICDALHFFGFEVNTKKSFGTGPFRESCGGDYFNGVEVRPFYLKKVPTEPQEWMVLANGLYRSGHFQEFSIRVSCLRRARDRALQALPSRLRKLRGPAELGDLVITDLEQFWETRTIDCIRWIRTWEPVSKRRVPWHLFTPDTKLASILYGVGADERGVIPRDSVTGYRLGWAAWS